LAADRNINIASKGYASIFHDQNGAPYPELSKVSELLDSTGLGNHPVLLKAFHWIAQQRGEDRFVEDSGPTADDVQSAREELARLRPPKGGRLTPQQLAEFSRPETQQRIAYLEGIINPGLA
jgi:hypothetical protein